VRALHGGHVRGSSDEGRDSQLDAVASGTGKMGAEAVDDVGAEKQWNMEGACFHSGVLEMVG